MLKIFIPKILILRIFLLLKVLISRIFILEMLLSGIFIMLKTLLLEVFIVLVLLNARRYNCKHFKTWK